MNSLLSIPTALCLPAPDIAALIQGRVIAALPRMFIRPGQKFALYPIDLSFIPISVDTYYRPSFLSIARSIRTKSPIEKVSIQAWAECEGSKIIDDSQSLEKLSRLTIWEHKGLEKILHQQQYIFLSYLRAYKLSESYKISLKIEAKKLGKFIGIPDSVKVSDTKPVLSDRTFSIRKVQLEKLEPPTYPELEEFLSFLSPLTSSDFAAEELERDIQVFLGWRNQQKVKHLDSDLVWIRKIAEVGNSSDGNEFERLVRKSFLKLGFSCSNNNPKANLDPEKLGGAGGVDFYCEYPYPVVGECKATKSEKVPSKTPGQLIQLGKNHLQDKYDPCVKIILAGGELTEDALLTTKNNQMNVITPETLEKLVELQSHYRGCIDLFEFKQCLQQEPFGLADEKVNRYINKIKQSIKL